MPVGGNILAIDYERYAKAEAALGWLNCWFRVESEVPISPALVIGPLLDALDEEFTAHKMQIVHLKISNETDSGYLKAALTANGQEPAIEGDLAASPERLHNVLLNIRAIADPSALQTAVTQHINRVSGSVEIESLRCFSPAPPRPERRLGSIVNPGTFE